MAVTSASQKLVAAERAVEITTAYCIADAGGNVFDPASVALFSVVEELAGSLFAAITPDEKAAAKKAFTQTIISMASISSALLNDIASRYDVGPFEILSGLATELYGSLT